MIAGVAALVLVVAIVVAGPWAYSRFIVGEQPEELRLPTNGGQIADGDPVALEGEWTVTNNSVAGYRVDEILWGQDVTVVGRTDQVSGTASIDDGALSGVSVSVDMASVETDDERRDNQYRGRIMDTETYPESTFLQTGDVTIPDGEGPFTVPVTGDLTVRGVTRTVTVDLDVQSAGDAVSVSGSVPVVFADFDIPEPSIAGIAVDDSGVIEFLLELERV